MHQTHRKHMPARRRVSEDVIWALGTYAFQFISLRHSLSWNHTHPLLPPLLRVDVQDFSGNEAWGDTVDSTEVNPFNGQALCQLNDTRL